MDIARHAPQSIRLLTASIGGLGGNGRTRLPLSNRLREEVFAMQLMTKAISFFGFAKAAPTWYPGRLGGD